MNTLIFANHGTKANLLDKSPAKAKGHLAIRFIFKRTNEFVTLHYSISLLIVNCAVAISRFTRSRHIPRQSNNVPRNGHAAKTHRPVQFELTEQPRCCCFVDAKASLVQNNTFFQVAERISAHHDEAICANCASMVQSIVWMARNMEHIQCDEQKQL